MMSPDFVPWRQNFRVIEPIAFVMRSPNVIFAPTVFSTMVEKTYLG
jgi:hypothetical protein